MYQVLSKMFYVCGCPVLFTSLAELHGPSRFIPYYEYVDQILLQEAPHNTYSYYIHYLNTYIYYIINIPRSYLLIYMLFFLHIIYLYYLYFLIFSWCSNAMFFWFRLHWRMVITEVFSAHWGGPNSCHQGRVDSSMGWTWEPWRNGHNKWEFYGILHERNGH